MNCCFISFICVSDISSGSLLGGHIKFSKFIWLIVLVSLQYFDKCYHYLHAIKPNNDGLKIAVKFRNITVVGSTWLFNVIETAQR